MLKANGVTPLALGDKGPWTATHLFETILIGKLGAEEYAKLWTGDLSFDDEKVIEGIGILEENAELYQ